MLVDFFNIGESFFYGSDVSQFVFLPTIYKKPIVLADSGVSRKMLISDIYIYISKTIYSLWIMAITFHKKIIKKEKEKEN